MKRNESKALARAKRLYERLKDMPLIRKANGKWRACESITEFLSLKWVKIYKESKFKRGMSDKLDAKQKNRKERHSKRKVIDEEIQEYESRYDEYYCPQCMHCIEGYCVEKHKWVNDNDYCEDFFD